MPKVNGVNMLNDQDYQSLNELVAKALRNYPDLCNEGVAFYSKLKEEHEKAQQAAKDAKYSLDKEFLRYEETPLVPCRKSGYASSTPGESGYKYAIFSRAEVEAKLGAITEENQDDIISSLVPWSSFSRGVGRSFGAEPYMKLYKRNILITQFTGLDI